MKSLLLIASPIELKAFEKIGLKEVTTSINPENLSFSLSRISDKASRPGVTILALNDSYKVVNSCDRFEILVATASVLSLMLRTPSTKLPVLLILFLNWNNQSPKDADSSSILLATPPTLGARGFRASTIFIKPILKISTTENRPLNALPSFMATG